jgi:hypothetical protein
MQLFSALWHTDLSTLTHWSIFCRRNFDTYFYQVRRSLGLGLGATNLLLLLLPRTIWAKGQIIDKFLRNIFDKFFIFLTTFRQLLTTFWQFVLTFFILMVLASCGNRYYGTNFIYAVPTSLLIAPGLWTIQFLFSSLSIDYATLDLFLSIYEALFIHISV